MTFKKFSRMYLLYNQLFLDAANVVVYKYFYHYYLLYDDMYEHM